MAIPKINSAMLAQAVEAAGPKISGYTSTIDGISEDIRNLEKWLLASGVRLRVTIQFTGGTAREYVDWCGGDDGKRWRVYYRRFDYKYDPAVDDFYEDMVVERPLIETPIEVRLRAVQPLTALIKEIASLIPERLIVPNQLSLFQ